MDPIEGGYYLKARCIEESAIAHAPPHIREIWDYILRKAFWKDGKLLKRGQLLTSYKEIIEALSWQVGFRKMSYKASNCETGMKYLTKHGMITKARTTRGMLITVCNYEAYQDMKSYENRNGDDTKPTREPHENRTIEKEGKQEEGILKEVVTKATENPLYTADFKTFWAACPRKVGKLDAARKFKQHKCGGFLDQILMALNQQKKSAEWKEEGGKYIPHPATWLHQGQWENEVVVDAQKKAAAKVQQLSRYEGT